MLLFYSRLLWMLSNTCLTYMETFCQISGLFVTVDKTKVNGNKGNKTNTLAHFLHTKENHFKWCKTSNILELLSHRQIGGMYPMGLKFKCARIVNLCLRIYATKVIFGYGK